jgi:general stress protein YciG
MTAPRKRGFAAMNREQQRAIASKGGRAAHRKGTAHEFSSEEARKAGYLGGKAVSANREHMAAIGRKGGQRASRALDAQRKAQTPERRDTNAANAESTPMREYAEHMTESPPVVLPHWREAAPELPQVPPETRDAEHTSEGLAITRGLPPRPGETGTSAPEEPDQAATTTDPLAEE